MTSSIYTEIAVNIRVYDAEQAFISAIALLQVCVHIRTSMHDISPLTWLAYLQFSRVRNSGLAEGVCSATASFSYLFILRCVFWSALCI